MSDETNRRVTRSLASKPGNEHLVVDPFGDTESEGSSNAGEERSYKKIRRGRSGTGQSGTGQSGTSLYPDLSSLSETLGEEPLRKRLSKRTGSGSGSPTGRSRSTSRSRTTAKSASPKETRKQAAKDKSRAPKSSTSWILWLLFVLTLVLGVVFGVGYENVCTRISMLWSKGPTYVDVLEKYHSDFIGPSRSVAETAIEKFLKNAANGDDSRPVVLLLYGHNQTKISELYLELAEKLARNRTIGRFDPRDTVTQVRNLKATRDQTVDKLATHKIVLFNGIENLKGSDYMELYPFVDEGDAYVQNCLVVISFYSEEIKRAKITLEQDEDSFEQVQQMESHVKSQLKRLWREVDISNLEAFFNRIISFPSFVF